MKVEFYPTPEQEEKLNSEASRQGVTVSVLLRDIINKYYGLVGPNTLTEAEIENRVFNEIADYIANNKGTEFDLNKASLTYEQIDMIYAGKPKVVKARIGKKFAQEIGKPGRFEDVRQVFLPNGKLKRTVKNRAALYCVDEK